MADDGTDPMCEPLFGTEPTVAESAFVSRQAYLVGDVAIGERASVWPFVCARGDNGSVAVGDETNVQEFTMLHGATLGERVSVGHGAVVDYATVDDDALVGMQSAVLRGATVESNCIVAAGAIVLQGQTVPEGHMAYGTPAETRPLTDDQRAEIGRVHGHYLDLASAYRAEGHFE